MITTECLKKMPNNLFIRSIINNTKIFMSFNDEETVDQFLNSVNEVFNFSNSKGYKIQGYFELRHFQQTAQVELENSKVWLTNVSVGK